MFRERCCFGEQRAVVVVRSRADLMAKKKSKFLQGRRVDPPPITKTISVADLIDESFLAYNASRLREACQLFTKKMLEPEGTIGLSLPRALTPTRIGTSALIPLILAGY